MMVLSSRVVVGRPNLFRRIGVVRRFPVEWSGRSPAPHEGILLFSSSAPTLGREARRSHGTLAQTETRVSSPPFGEVAFRASVFGNPGALSGHIFLEPSGRAAFVSDGVQAVGRGVGRWVSKGGVAAVELDVYQYAAAAAIIPDKPHRFRGLWMLADKQGPVEGDWYFLPEGRDEPRLVGSFEVQPGVPPMALGGVGAGAPRPQLRAAVRDQLFATLDDTPAPARAAEEVAERLAPFRVGDIPTVYYIPNWIDAAQEEEFMHHSDVELNAWEHMRTRSSQEWGAGDRCVCGRGLSRTPLPPKHQRLANALHHLGVFDGALWPMNSVRLNAYTPGQGIFPHCDGPVYYPMVAILSMASPCVFSLYPKTGTEDCMKWDPQYDVPGGHPSGQRPQVSLILEPRSLVCFGQDAFWHHRHGIEAVTVDQVPQSVCNLHVAEGTYKVGEHIQRKRRVSLTMRHLLPRCACQG